MFLHCGIKEIGEPKLASPSTQTARSAYGGRPRPVLPSVCRLQLGVHRLTASQSSGASSRLPCPLRSSIHGGKSKGWGDRCRGSVVGCATESGGTQGATPALQELQGDTFWETLGKRPAGSRSVVLCYTSKCMPCKEVKPILEGWAKTMPDVGFYQFALTLPNKECALSMGVNSSPTFLVIQDGTCVSKMKGKASLSDLYATLCP